MKKYYHLLGILILIIILVKIDFKRLILNFSGLNMLHLVFVNLIILPTLFIKSFRWHYLLRLQGIDYSVSNSVMSYLGGIYAGIVTPGRVGETIKALYLKQDKNIPFSEAMASIFIDRLLDFYLLVLLSCIGFFHFLDIRNIKYGIFILLLGLFLFFISLLVLNRIILEKIVKLIYKSMISGLDKNLFEGQFKVFFSSVKKIISKNIYLPFLLTIGAYLFYFLQCYLLARLASINISYMAIVSFVSISSLVSLLPITILGIGTREASLVYLFSLIHLNAERAVTYSFLLFLSFYVISGLLAFSGWYAKSRDTINNNG